MILHLLLSWMMLSHIAKFMGPVWGPTGSCRPPMDPMLAPWTILSEMFMTTGFCCIIMRVRKNDHLFATICKSVLLSEKLCISFAIALKIVSNGPAAYKSISIVQSLRASVQMLIFHFYNVNFSRSISPYFLIVYDSINIEKCLKPDIFWILRKSLQVTK